MVSHTLDMMSSVNGVEHDLHGRQVGIGTVLASELYRRVLAIESPEYVAPVEWVDKVFWGPLATVVAGHYAGKVERLHLAVERLQERGAWDDLRARLGQLLRTPQEVSDCLCRAGAACRAEDIHCDKARLLAALVHAHEIRPRFTILDLARLVGVLPAAAGEIVKTWG